MNVLMTADTVGGVWTYAVELARALGARGVEVTLATMGARLSPVQQREAASFDVRGSEYRLEWMDDPWDDVARAGEWLLELEREINPDVVHLNGYAHGALPWRAPVVVVAHSCVLSWWEAVRGEPAPPSWDRYRREVAAGIAAADAVAAPTRAMLACAERFYGPVPRPRVVPNGRSATLFAPGPKEPLVFAAGRLWDEAKNIAALARVAPRLGWRVAVAGDATGPDGGQASTTGVHAVGYLAPGELAAWLARASVYALPARYEPFGLSILEAALAGCALVLGDIPSLREVWGGAAVYVDPDDDAAVAAGVASLIAQPALRAALARAARRRALALTPEASADGYLRLYADAKRAYAQKGAVACAS